MVLSGRPASRPITAIVSRHPSPSVVAARAQPKESRMIRFVVSTTDAGSRSKDCSAANSESAAKGGFSEAYAFGMALSRGIARSLFTRLQKSKQVVRFTGDSLLV